jgi:hypothetical protein
LPCVKTFAVGFISGATFFPNGRYHPMQLLTDSFPVPCVGIERMVNILAVHSLPGARQT